MRTVKDIHTKKYLKFATSQRDVTTYLWQYHRIATDIMKSAQSWYIYLNGKFFGVGAKTLDRFPIQHWATIYNWLKDNPESIVYCMPYISWEEYLLNKSNDITLKFY